MSSGFHFERERRLSCLACRSMMLHSRLQMPDLNTSSKAIRHRPLPRPELFASLVMAVALFLTTFNVIGANAQQPPQQTLYYIPHTHWEGAVFKTREEYLEMGLPHILKALYLLDKYPEFKFTLDQVAYFKPFLERYPEAAAAFRKYVAQGRLQIVGGMDVMPDVVKPGGELFVRQVQYGKRYCRDKLGVEVTVGWFFDTF